MAAKRSSKRRHICRRQLTTAGLLIVALIGILYGSSYFVQRYISFHAPLPKPGVVVHDDTAAPTETPVSTATASYTVAADMPRLITLPSIGASGFIQQVSVDAAGAMATPTNVNFAGWYTRSVKPGDPGLSVIDGHVIGYYGPGIFKNLVQLKPADHFSVQFGDGSTRTFSVVGVTSYAVSDVMSHLLARDPAIAAQLNLVTCGGSFNQTAHEYDQRVIVVAERV